MKLVADLHVHSRFSRATSRELDFVALHRSAAHKGVHLVGTGDFTHPGWMAEIEQMLEPAEQGLFRLKPELARQATQDLPPSCRNAWVRFVLQVEISNIYRRDNRVRKNHNLAFVPSFDAAKRFTHRLAAIGNVASDGRPILGLDARDLLEITLSADPLAFLVPAHIWTPWFSMLGSKSGFDSVAECFRDLSAHVFAVETGLSSDPAMNWRVRDLDRMTLISNSDAHSPSRLGREANLLDIEPGYEPLLQALRTRRGFLGTVEFFPEEGKYHLDGHRKCSVRLDPHETKKLGGRCPECGALITVGVMSRVTDLADREPGIRPDGARPFTSLVSLPQAVAQAIGSGADSQKTAAAVGRIVETIGPELVVLREAPIDEVQRIAGAHVAEAVRRVRAGELTIDAGYDGEFGTVSIFKPGELDRIAGQASLIAPGNAAPAKPRASRARKKPPAASSVATSAPADLVLLPSNDPCDGLDPSQLAVVRHGGTPLLVVAGPGTGKTRALAARVAEQVRSGQVRADQVLAISFTNQAADELRSRLAVLLPQAADRLTVCTFHGLGLRLLREHFAIDAKVMDDDERTELVRKAAGPDTRASAIQRMVQRISLAKQSVDPEASLLEDAKVLEAFRAYEGLRADSGQLDVDDLVLEPVRLLDAHPDIAASVAQRYRSVSVDEYQDVNDVQARLVRQLCPDGRSLCVIGDPDQAIYGFRGARPEHFQQFAQSWPGATGLSLSTTWRLSRQVLAVAKSVMGRSSAAASLQSNHDGPPVELIPCPTAASEAEQVLVRIERIVGGTSLFAIDTGRGRDAEEPDVGFGDIAVLVRTKAQREELLEALGRSGVPCRAIGEDEPHDPRSQKVAVMTMHASKGREFEVVFVTGVERGLVPLEAVGLRTDREEERRLLYVAITRARRLVVLSHAAKRTLFGAGRVAGPSPFLARLPRDAVAAMDPGWHRREPIRQLKLF